MPDPRIRKARHELTPDNLSSSLLISNLPSSWTQSTVTSVIAGSGPIVKVSEKKDPRNGRLIGIVIDYLTSKDCKRAAEVIQKIKNFTCKLERIIPPNWSSRTEVSDRDVLDLKRDQYPWDDNLELPFELVSEVPIPRKPVSKPATGVNTNGSGTSPFPEILSKASQHLPPLHPGSLVATEPISANLTNIPPLQLLEMISNLKMLSNQDPAKIAKLEQFLRNNSVVTMVTVAQALLEMGFINYEVVTKVISEYQPLQTQNTMRQPVPPVNFAQPPAMPHMSTMLNMMHPQMMATPHQASQVPTTGPFIIGQAPPPMTQQSQPMRLNETKLNALPRAKQDMIRQVINLPQEQIRLLPPEQVTVIENLRQEYLI
ncbi:AGR009Cp [Eremothecium gossypii ATCC 10895]|uniref:AGR009Cp n=1 Tax=Eremothecium gossypii (strain ATCC 10895 / CBS 109.51 / FGSC 9923 / NRRL Y-1056) TaxID=284811 RepID=Q750E6_EREGS|nr:AGR009Cp [Eremothecium gossypii ATCC 10895]AAS54498.2 AGR009Cp [Eremothecium gossypii ATCC 10895]AEY98830.1 FAGR009Cp [Eremothecium gossypii FDAG1]